ncbi:GNAT family N-acetyltransferase [Alkalihalophilus marmarensis]|uniref:GCN5 family acetyltransferase n=1 Tax=Alkalihalophilus marmarensis DSM 21297 TaxID=1188261 RepID=U6SQH9_9BACI|nr:GNAT family N-acetyltransferase [Alkalihalophilus marmarensis]ERN53647.1 GCN5 family acetyltransferase [Alkalihalophilus marmarensis DSM 21297]
MVTHELLAEETINQLIQQINKEKNLLFFSYLTQRRDSALFIGQYVEGHLTAVLGYISNFPFPAFSFYCVNVNEVYVPELMTFTREVTELDHKIICGTILGTKELELFEAHNLLKNPPQTFLSMKHVDESNLLDSTISKRVIEEEFQNITRFLHEGGMKFFMSEELIRCPFYGVKEENQFIAAGGFHFYDRSYVELGNIYTHPEYRGRGLGKKLTSELTHLGIELTSDIYLGVLGDNLPAIRLYKDLGYETAAQVSIVDFSLA